MDIRYLYTPHQLDLLKQFRERLSDTTDEQKRWCDDRCLLRYLRAREWKLSKSEKMIRETLKWREEFKPYNIKFADVAHGAVTGKMYRYGNDKEGHPVVILQPKNENLPNGSEHRQAKLRLLAYTLERAIESMPPGVEKMVILVDFKGWKMSQRPDLQTTKEFLGVLGNHYPERLSRAIVCDPPGFFTVFWNAIKGFVDPVSVKKLVMTKTEKPEPIYEVMPKRSLLKLFRGEADWSFEIAAYTAMMKDADEIRFAKYDSGELVRA